MQLNYMVLAVEQVQMGSSPLTNCSSETGLLPSWSGIGSWLVQLPSECKLQKPAAKGLTPTFHFLTASQALCLNLQFCAKAGTCALSNFACLSGFTSRLKLHIAPCTYSPSQQLKQHSVQLCRRPAALYQAATVLS